MEVVSYQFSMLSAAILYGGFLGLFFDFYRLLCLIYRPGKWLQMLFDLLWWLVAFLLLFLFWFFLTSGEIRLLIFIWFGIGFFLYSFALSRYARSGLLRAWDRIRIMRRFSGQIRQKNRLIVLRLADIAYWVFKPFYYLGVTFWYAGYFLRTGISLIAKKTMESIHKIQFHHNQDK